MRLVLHHIFIVAFIFLVTAPSFAQTDSPIYTAAKQAIVLDYDTGSILMEKNADKRMPTSSMSKVMTMYMIFDALKRGELSLNDRFLVSEKAWRKGGSKMFVEVDKKVRIEDLIRGVLIQSGNDATIVLAEGLAGSETIFAERMTFKAKEIGMENSNFVNASGWPSPNHYSTARDLGTMARSMIANFPEYYGYFSEKEFTYNNITQKNRNPLLYRKIGADGLKTGHTQAGGYGLIGSGTYDGRRVIIIINGMESEKERAQESAKLMEWALRRFINKKLFSADDIVETTDVALGTDNHVNAVLGEDLSLTLPRLAIKEIKVSASFAQPLIAPIEKGQEIGKLTIKVPQMPDVIKPLYAAQKIKKVGFISGAFAKAKIYFSGRGQ